MKLFISWSGPDVGLPVANALASWLPKVIPDVELWISPAIGTGMVGVQALVDALRESDGGLVIVTPESQVSPWVLFEAGAFAVKGRFFPYLVGMSAPAVRAPFSHFQYKASSRADSMQLVRDIALAKAIVEEAAPAKTNETSLRNASIITGTNWRL